jgi:hypothetical protein
MIEATLVVAFAVVFGHLLWGAWLGPAPQPVHVVGGEFMALMPPDPSARHLYARRELYLPQQPRHAWIQVIARDRLELFVNGMMVQRKTLDGFSVAVVADLTPFLRSGRNVIAVHARQSNIRQGPAIAVEGGYRLSDGDHPLFPDDRWHCSTMGERKTSWWFSQEFDERQWPLARVERCQLSAKVETPPRALQQPDEGRWVTPPQLEGGSATLFRKFRVQGRPREAWLRLTTSGNYRVALNGILFDQEEDQLGVALPEPPARRIYDVTTLLRPGDNVLTITLTDEARTPHLLADVEVLDDGGRCVRFGTDREWVSCPGIAAGWLRDSPAAAAPARPCLVDVGDLNMPSRGVRRQPVRVALPWGVIVWRAAWEFLVMALTGLVVVFACRVVAWRMLGLSTGVAVLALAPATLVLAAAFLATYDPRVTSGDVYRPLWIWLALASVLAQWMLLAGHARGAEWASGTGISLRPIRRRLVVGVMLAALLAIGFWLRIRDIKTEDLQWDEVENYHATRGFLERGFPSMIVHEDLPILYTHTSELEFVPHALVALVTNDPAYILRLPPIVFSTLTIGLLFLVGRRMFGTTVGLVAAALLAFAPGCISLSTVGRYFSQLQFFALLSVYCLWRTVSGQGPLNRRTLWWTVAAFVCMFFTWEASALVAVGLALATLMERRSRLVTVFREPALYAGAAVVAACVLLQRSHATLAQTQFLWYGLSLSDVRLVPMWNAQTFQPWYYLWQSSWNQDALLPLLGFTGAVLLAVRGAWSRPTRFLLLIHVPTCLLMGFFLPTSQFRYVHHLLPLAILLAAAAFVALARSLRLLASQTAVPRAWRFHANGLSVGVLIFLVALASGMTIELREMERMRMEGMLPQLFKYPDLGAPSRYVRDHMRPGDVLLANHIYQVNHLMGQPRVRRPTDYTLVTGPFYLPATLTDREGLLVDRRDGARVICSQAQLEDLFARHPRIWYIAQPGQHTVLNTPMASTFLREHMDIVYEDWETLVLFRGGAHRPVDVRMRDDRALNSAKANYLP